jgi:hypothetical protein
LSADFSGVFAKTVGNGFVLTDCFEQASVRGTDEAFTIDISEQGEGQDEQHKGN